ncbi:hypothetical protein BWI17_04330 [Betaproteobacteria bacterium GR16-43]|nr:hypothetical protein BWI17_04330 [Betaproteobacteria bacterium GR16-43]
MGGGYVLDFSDRTFAEFFSDELSVDIDDPRYRGGGDSKAKRLRYYLRSVSAGEALKCLHALWGHRETLKRRGKVVPEVPGAADEFSTLVLRLAGKTPDNVAPSTQAVPTALDEKDCETLRNSLLETSQLEGAPRGYAFERFLNELFALNKLKPREPFRNRGEQIDGSFQLEGDTYLLEAKWTKDRVDAGVLRAFNAKVEDKSSWSRGLLVSECGFSEDGLYAFGRGGKKILCMDGMDLADMLHSRIRLSEVIARKARRAAETGLIFVRVRDLF